MIAFIDSVLFGEDVLEFLDGADLVELVGVASICESYLKFDFWFH